MKDTASAGKPREAGLLKKQYASTLDLFATLRLMNDKLFSEIERLRFLNPDLYVWWQERAGIMEYDGGLSREDAENEALHLARQKKAHERKAESKA